MATVFLNGALARNLEKYGGISDQQDDCYSHRYNPYYDSVLSCNAPHVT